jgi:hypothetical protein
MNKDSNVPFVETSWDPDDDYRRYDVPEPRMTWRSVVFAALMCLWWNKWARWVMIAFAVALLVTGIVDAAVGVDKLMVGVQ